MRICQECHAEFAWERKPGQRGRTKIYCSDRCSWRARYVPKDRKPADPAARSAAAKAAASARWAKAEPADRSDAASKAARARYTDEQSRAAAERRADRDARRSLPCPYCGDPVGRAGRVKCPKPECHLKHLAARMAPINAQRRARKTDPDAERFDPREVFDRDEWTCGICGDPVDPDLRFPDPASPSLDHLVPLSRGGAHTRDNTRCAHFGCNAARGNRDLVRS